MADSTDAPNPKPVRPDVDRKARLRIPAYRPSKQDPVDRTKNWDEVYDLFTGDIAKIDLVDGRLVEGGFSAGGTMPETLLYLTPSP